MAVSQGDGDEVSPGETSTGACERCGRPVHGEFTWQLAAKLAQLSRFGLTGHPILARRRR